MDYRAKRQRPDDGGEMGGEEMDGAELYGTVLFDVKEFTRQQLAAIGEPFSSCSSLPRMLPPIWTLPPKEMRPRIRRSVTM